MHVESVELVDFGPHEKLKLDFTSNVSGIKGENGSGKTIFKTAVDFSFTGNLGSRGEPMATFVRGFGKGPANGSVRTVFTKGGRRGSIFRQIGKTTKRELQWDGKTYTSDSEVARIMEGILGASGEAVQRAVFVPQGKLDEILFGTEGSRADAFAHMMVLDWTGRIDGILEKKIKTASADLVDLTPALDEATREEAEALGRQGAAKRELDAVKDPGEALKAWHAWKTAHDEFGQAAALAQTMNLLAEQSAASYRDAIGSYESPEAIGAALDKTTKELTVMRADVEKYEHRATLAARLADAKGMLTELDGREIPKPGMSEITRDGVAAIAGNLSAIIFRDKTAAALEKVERQLAECAATRLGAEQNEARFTDELRKAEVLQKLHTVQYEARAKRLRLREAYDKSQVCCDTCGRLWADFIPEDLPSRGELLALVNESETFLKSVADDITRLKKDIAEAAGKKSASEMMAESLGKRKAELTTEMETMVPPGTVGLREDAEATLAAAEKSAQAWEAWRKASADHNTRLQVAMETVEARTTELSACPETVAKDRYDLCIRSIGTMLPEVEKLRVMKALATSKLADMEKAADDKAKQTGKVKTASASADALELAKNSVIAALAPEAGDKADTQLAVLETMYNTRIALEATLAAAKTEAGRSSARVKELQTRIASDARRRRLIDHLKRLRELFSRRGISGALIDYEFRRVALATQRNLEVMDVDFAVEPDPFEPVSFRFRRTDLDDEPDLPQCKLSGGQRGVLAVAFLIAVQQCLIPEVGFLYLDEPTTHVDDERVAKMRDFFLSIREKMQGSDWHIMITDHHKTMEAAFGETFHLKRKKKHDLQA